jgi:hypothetical protein
LLAIVYCCSCCCLSALRIHVLARIPQEIDLLIFTLLRPVHESANLFLKRLVFFAQPGSMPPASAETDFRHTYLAPSSTRTSCSTLTHCPAVHPSRSIQLRSRHPTAFNRDFHHHKLCLHRILNYSDSFNKSQDGSESGCVHVRER